MGISSDWVSILKGEAPTAFTEKLDAPNLQGAFIDGQIQLMKSDALRTWSQFYNVQYAAPIEKLLKLGPDTMTVVLAFDDYTHVPASKAMTQTKRRSKTVPLEFDEKDELPPNCPPDWAGAMANRVFKTRVIHRICQVLPGLLNIRGRQRVIVDFMGDPIEYSAIGTHGAMIVGGAKGCFMRKLPNFPGIGESDCKFPRWVDFICKLHPHRAVDVIVESTDSDYIVIGMIHYEMQIRRLEREGAARETLLGRVILHRMACHGKQHAAGEVAKSGRKRKADWETKTEATGNKATAAKPKRMFEYVHIPLLYEIMLLTCKPLVCSKESKSIRSLAVLIALAGTDFSRPTPQLGANRVWENLPLLLRENKKFDFWGKKPEKKEEEMCVLNINVVRDRLLAGIYATVWSAHCKQWDCESFSSVRECILKSKLGEKTKAQFPTMESIDTTIRNVVWTVLYWEAAGKGDMRECPDPIQPAFGFALDAKGRPAWSDCV